MNPELTEIVIIVDRSGSMSRLAEETITGMNHLIEEQEEAPGEARLTLALFDDQYEQVFENRRLEEVPWITSKTYYTRGWTALLDAVGKTVDAVGHRLALTPEEFRPSKVIVVVITDGMENASSKFTFIQIAEKIKHQEEKYGWKFVFSGAGMDAWAQGAVMGVAASASLNYIHSDIGTRALYGAVSKGIARARSVSGPGVGASLDSMQADYEAELQKEDK